MVHIKGKRSVLALLAGLAVFVSMPAYSAFQVWNWGSGSNSFGGSGDGNTLSMTSSDGVNLTVTAWSDTDDVNGPDNIESAELIWANGSSLGAANRDEGSGFPSSPHHGLDSFLSGNDPDGEFEMLLLEFDTSVNLEGLDLSWARDGDISILAYDGSGSSSLAGNTWADVLAGNYDLVGNYNSIGTSYYAVNSGEVFSTKWLVGVYNPVFGAGSGLDANDDSIKIDLVKTSTRERPPGDVPVPGSVPLIILGLALLRGRMSARRTAA